MIKKVAFIAQPTRNIEAARSFYGEALGLDLSADYGEIWCEFSTPEGATIALDAILPTTSESPIPYMALETDDIEAEVARLREAGATIAREPWTNTGADGKEICKMAMVLDPDGNPIMLHQIASWRG
jgi:predicted enzyme related to lactoylglutathione lyase